MSEDAGHSHRKILTVLLLVSLPCSRFVQQNRSSVNLHSWSPVNCSRHSPGLCFRPDCVSPAWSRTLSSWSSWCPSEWPEEKMVKSYPAHCVRLQ